MTEPPECGPLTACEFSVFVYECLRKLLTYSSMILYRPSHLVLPDSFPQRILAGHLADVDCVRFHPNGNYIATGSTDRTCRLWQITTGECVRVFEGHADSVQCLAFTEDGRFLASGGDDCNVVLWDIAEGKRIKTYRGHDDVLLSVSFSGEGSLVVSAAADDTVRVWDATVSADELRDAIEGDEEDDDDDETAASGTNELAVFPTKGSDST